MKFADPLERSCVGEKELGAGGACGCVGHGCVSVWVNEKPTCDDTHEPCVSNKLKPIPTAICNVFSNAQRGPATPGVATIERAGESCPDKETPRRVASVAACWANEAIATNRSC